MEKNEQIKWYRFSKLHKSWNYIVLGVKLMITTSEILSDKCRVTLNVNKWSDYFISKLNITW